MRDKDMMWTLNMQGIECDVVLGSINICIQ
jgi:hypothetical protein